MKTLIILVLCLIYSLIGIFAYHKGVEVGVRIVRTGTSEKIKPAKAVKAEPTIEETIAMNIENYRGDGKGQIDLEDS